MEDNVCIILIDDNEIDLMIGKRIISRVDSKVHVETFISEKEAISWIGNKGKDYYLHQLIFIIDIYLPFSNGFTLIKKIKALLGKFTKEPTFYVASATIDQLNQSKAKRDPDIKSFIGKPLNLEIITKMLHPVNLD